MSARAIMLQGTGSDVGKSLLTAGLCRLAVRRGLRVAPFKPQNMSNNAAATADGGEIGRAQALQARAAGLAPRTDFNPVLLKPQSDCTAQVIVHGRANATLSAADYFTRRETLIGAVLESFARLSREFDLVLVEGAGSPAEINLRARDIANMGFARAADVPVVLIGDIDRGGVIASLVGTQAVIAPNDAAMIVGFIVNKFRGDPALFTDGMAEIVARTGWRSFGLVPWLDAVARLPAEDAVDLARSAAGRNAPIKLVAPLLSRIANFDDADPLRAEPDVDFSFVPPGRALPRDADVVLLLGTKSTRGDLAFLRAQGWDVDIAAHVRAGGRVIGLCGGYQMLGRTIADPDGVDGEAGVSAGLGLLAVDTIMAGDKQVRPVEGTHLASGALVSGYEIHVGRTDGPDCARPMLNIDGRTDGAMSADGRIAGCYLHGLFNGDAFRSAWLQSVNSQARSNVQFDDSVEAAIDALADGLEEALDVDALLDAAR
jgi:adenosylcobyric acid synthase